MKSATGRWVSGDDFFDRESELQVLDARVRAGNHTLLTGQRRMGKTSVVRELGRRLEDQGWVFLFTDVEGATCAEDVIADIAQTVHPVASRFATGLRGVLQGIGADSPVLIVSGSIGLTPLVQRLGIPDRINYLDPLRPGPWDRHARHHVFRTSGREPPVAGPSSHGCGSSPSCAIDIG